MERTEGQKKAIQYFQDAIAIDPRTPVLTQLWRRRTARQVPYCMGPKEARPLVK